MDGHLVAVADGLGRRRTLDDRQADIDRVAVEDAGEAVRDDELNTAGLDGDGRVLAEPQPKLRPATMMRLVSLLRLKSLSRSSMQWAASSAGSVVLR